MILNNDNPSDKRQYTSRWPLVRGKQLFKSFDERSIDGSEELLTVSHITGITPRKKKNVTMFMAESLVGYKKCYKEDIAANTMWMWQGAIGVSKYTGVISPSYDVYRQKQELYIPQYLDLLLREKTLVDVYHSLSTGIRPSRLRLYPDQLFSILFPVPPKREQEQIIRYLDWQVSKINRLILALKKQIALLNEKRQLIINNAVTKGLDTAAKLVDCGEPCIGLIPTTWDSCQLKYKAEIYNGNSISDSEKEKYTVKSDLSYIATKDIDLATGAVNYDNGLYVPVDSNFKIAPKGSSLVCIEGGSAGKKKALMSRDVAFVNKLCAFIARGMNDKYLYYYLCSKAFTSQFNKNMTGLIGGVSISAIKRQQIPVPPITEQQVITEFLDIQCSKYDAIISQIGKEIDLLHELRTRLISDVVTGQIDVRGIEVPEFEYVEETSDEEDGEDVTDEECGTEVE